MARIRTLKPEFFHDKDLAKCSPHARLLAVALLQLADCEGRIRNIPMQIHSHAFPWEAEVNTPSLLGELQQVGFVILWEYEGEDYIWIPKFTEHQRLQGKEAQMESKLPAYDPEKHENKGFTEKGSNGEYPSASRGITGKGTGEQGNRGIGTGEKEKEMEQGNRELSVALKHDPVLAVFEYWQTMMNHPKAAFSTARKKIIKQWLAHYDEDDLKKAIRGCSQTPHNMGQNDRGEVYDSIELILRDAKQIDRFMRNDDHPPNGGIKTIQQTKREADEQADRVGRQLFGDQYATG